MATSYLHNVLSASDLAACVETAKKRLTGLDFDHIAVTGNSGTLFGGALAVAMQKDLILVRKPTVNSHASAFVEHTIYDNALHRYVIVDDFVESGRTIQVINTAIDRDAALTRQTLKHVGTYLYKYDTFNELGDENEPRTSHPDPWL